MEQLEDWISSALRGDIQCRIPLESGGIGGSVEIGSSLTGRRAAVEKDFKFPAYYRAFVGISAPSSAGTVRVSPPTRLRRAVRSYRWISRGYAGDDDFPEARPAPAPAASSAPDAYVYPSASALSASALSQPAGASSSRRGYHDAASDLASQASRPSPHQHPPTVEEDVKVD